MAYEGLKDLPTAVVSDKALHDKAFHFAKSPKCGSYQRESLQ